MLNIHLGHQQFLPVLIKWSKKEQILPGNFLSSGKANHFYITFPFV